MATNRGVTSMSTGIPLSQRFERTQPAKVQQVNSPFRMDFGIGGNSNKSVSGLEDDDDLFGAGNFGKPTMTFNRGLQGFGSGRNNDGDLLAIKEAEIRRLRAQLTLTKARLIIATNGNVARPKELRMHQTPAFKGTGTGFIRKRGGVRVGNSRRQLNMIGNSKASQLFAKSKLGVSPLNRNATGAKSGGNSVLGKPRSREDLDADLEAYMSKSKGKAKTDLDKELDDYMKARQQSVAAKAGRLTSATASTTFPTEDMDATMEIL